VIALKNRKDNTQPQKQVPTIAPGLELDELEASATEEEIARGDSTSVTKLFIDRVD
jgi:hypothetical protein